jgi:choline dehydrogenase
MQSGSDLGYKSIDYNSGELIGFSRLQVNQRKGRRCSGNKAFLRPVRQRNNLHVAKEALATKVHVDPHTNRAWGVEFQRNNHRYFVRARKEVILSAGAIDTPKLLMLSGIGPRKHLESFGIPVVKDAPGVGNNLQEHVTTSAVVFKVNEKKNCRGLTSSNKHYYLKKKTASQSKNELFQNY